MTISLFSHTSVFVTYLQLSNGIQTITLCRKGYENTYCKHYCVFSNKYVPLLFTYAPFLLFWLTSSTTKDDGTEILKIYIEKQQASLSVKGAEYFTLPRHKFLQVQNASTQMGMDCMLDE